MSHGAPGASVTFDPEPIFIIQRAAGQQNIFRPGTEVTSANYHSTDYPQLQGPYTIRWSHSTAGPHQLQNASLNVEFDNTNGFEFGKIENGSFVKFRDKPATAEDNFNGITVANLQDFNILTTGASELKYHVMLLADMLNSSPSYDFFSNIKTIELTELTTWYELLVHSEKGTGPPDDITLKFNTEEGEANEGSKYCRVYLRQIDLVNNGDLANPDWRLEKTIIPPENFSSDAYNIEKLYGESDNPSAVRVYENDHNVVGTLEGEIDASAQQLGPPRIMYRFDKTKLFEQSTTPLAKYRVTLRGTANIYLGLNNEQLSATITLKNYFEQ